MEPSIFSFFFFSYCPDPCREEISKVRSVRKVPREAFCCVSEQACGVGCSPEQSGGNWEEESDTVPSGVTSISEHGGYRGLD